MGIIFIRIEIVCIQLPVVLELQQAHAVACSTNTIQLDHWRLLDLANMGLVCDTGLPCISHRSNTFIF